MPIVGPEVGNRFPQDAPVYGCTAINELLAVKVLYFVVATVLFTALRLIRW